MKKYFNAFKFLWNKSPSHLVWYATGICNARCRMCFYWKTLEKEKKQRKELRLGEIKKISKSMGHIKVLSVTGGEPMLRKDLVDCIEVFYKNNGIQNIVFHTNGLLPKRAKEVSEQILKRCPNAHLSVGLSLDSLEEKHDYIRGVKGIFKKLIQTAKLLKQVKKKNKRFSVSVATVFSKYNQDEIEEVYSFVRNKLKLPFNLVFVRGDTKECIAKDVDVKKYLEMEKRIKSEKDNKVDSDFVGSSLKKVLDEIIPEVVYEIKTTNKMFLPCVAGKKSLVLYEEGDLYPCELLNKSFGNVRTFDYNIPKMLKTKKAKDILNFIKKRKCVCTWECVIPINIIFSPKMYPKIFWIYLRNLFKRK